MDVQMGLSCFPGRQPAPRLNVLPNADAVNRFGWRKKFPVPGVPVQGFDRCRFKFVRLKCVEFFPRYAQGYCCWMIPCADDKQHAILHAQPVQQSWAIGLIDCVNWRARSPIDKLITLI